MNRFGKICGILLAFVFLLINPCPAENLKPAQQKILDRSWIRNQDGWLVVHIEGAPYERGLQYGYRLANEIVHMRDCAAQDFQHNSKQPIELFYTTVDSLFAGKLDTEYREELNGMVDGAKLAGKNLTFHDLLLVNAFFDLGYWWENVEKKKHLELEKDHCSSFIAVDSMTQDGEIVLAHNTWFDYYYAAPCRIILEVVPKKGHKMLMQNIAGMLFSGTDFFITDAGLVGSETTISKFTSFDMKGVPVALRARKAMQYANSITDWVELISQGNNGGYANAWLLGDINTREIARLELGLKYTSLERTKKGYFVGSNIAENTNILQTETTSNPNDYSVSNVARRVRWHQLMKQYQGKIDVPIAKTMLGDHFDTYLGLVRPDSRCLCGHVVLDATRADDPAEVTWGAFDGKVVNSTLARQWSFWAKWGSSCDLGLDAKKFLSVNPKLDWAKDFIQDIHSEPWTLISTKTEKKKR